MSKEQTKAPLPEALMKAIKVTVESPGMTAGEKFEAVLLMAHGYGLWAAQDRIDPTSFAIPEDQWKEVSGMLTDVPDDAEGKVNMALEWMNNGPSGYRP